MLQETHSNKHLRNKMKENFFFVFTDTFTKDVYRILKDEKII